MLIVFGLDVVGVDGVLQQKLLQLHFVEPLRHLSDFELLHVLLSNGPLKLVPLVVFLQTGWRLQNLLYRAMEVLNFGLWLRRSRLTHLLLAEVLVVLSLHQEKLVFVHVVELVVVGDFLL